MTLEISNNKLKCGWMTSCSTKKLAGSELDQAGDWSEVSTD